MKFIKILLIFFVLNSCNQDDVKDIEIEVFRFDQEFALLDSNNLENTLVDWNEKLDNFHMFYFDKYLAINILNDEQYKKDISLFIMDSNVIAFNTEILNKFNNINESVIPALEIVFGRMNYYLPAIETPKGVITVNSFQSYGMATYGDTLIIGLDMYLGKENKYYVSSDYLNFMNQEKFLSVDALENWLNYTYHEPDSHHDTFLDELIFKGKMVYLLYKFIPDYNLNDVLKYSIEELTWCEQNEYNIWNEIIQLDLIYESDIHKFLTFFTYSPFTKGMPKESPGRLGYFIGYKIIDSYMQKNNVDLQELMQNINSQEIFLESKYKP